MLEKFIPKLAKEMELEETSLSTGVPGSYSLQFEEGVSISMTDMPNGFILKTNVAPFPAAKQEEFLTQTMLANLFGQGTCDGVLGSTPDGNLLTLTRTVDYPVDYSDFRAMVEDFINMMDFWREEALSNK